MNISVIVGKRIISYHVACSIVENPYSHVHYPFHFHTQSLSLCINILFPQSRLFVASVLDLIGGSRSTTPVSLHSRKSPTADMGTQVNQKDGNRRNQNQRNGPHNQQMDRRDSGNNQHDNRVSSHFCFQIIIQISASLYSLLRQFVLFFSRTEPTW